MIEALAAGLAAGYGIAVPVGAVAVYLVSLTARTSLRTGVSAALGVATADGLYAALAVAGGAALAPLIEPVAAQLRWGSAAVLIGLAGHGVVSGIRRYRSPAAEEPPVRAARAYLGLFGVTLLNPLTVVYFTVLVLGGQAEVAADAGERTVFVLAAFAASASWQLLLACGGALLGRVLTGRRGQLVTAVAAGLLVAGLAVGLVVR
ncbi:LysE family transporter [Amycolatopsis suaedae]|uniref:Lysine transporter LysE n=1 Tax=Amycolatopsis suaedae TaxID=2510978 RepID=A0A4Q7JF24_9PSEU|nr:LysE family transporter [Amycolatopsis suaedae]RZQ65796.1 lysine transporter LysE [Amycolatopsis suaedae]